MADRDVLRVTLEYPDINWLFDQPDVSPFSETFHEYSTRPGIEDIYNELHANPSLKRVETTILLPPEQITPALEQRTREAVRRYCLARSREVGQDERALRWRALRALAIALVLFVPYVIVYKPLQESEIWLLPDRRRIEYRNLDCSLVSTRCPCLRRAVLSNGLRELQARFGNATGAQTGVLKRVCW